IKPISGMGSLMDLRIEITNLDAGEEDIAIDNIQICEGTSPTPPSDIDLQVELVSPDTCAGSFGISEMVTFRITNVGNTSFDGSYTYRVNYGGAQVESATNMLNLSQGASETITTTGMFDLSAEQVLSVEIEVVDATDVDDSNNSFIIDLSSVCPQPELLITEVMYNPRSSEDDWEWVEVYNSGILPISVDGYVLDDGNSSYHSTANVGAGIVGPGQTAVLYNADDLDADDFVSAWGARINLIPVTGWSRLSLNNSGDILALWSSFSDYDGDEGARNNAIAIVDFDDSAPWPIDDGSSSIYLTDLTAIDPYDGSNWSLSAVGAATPAGGAAYMSRAESTSNGGEDIGSPGGEFVFPGELLLSEIAVTPSDGEFIEIYNPNDFAVDLEDIYLTDATNVGIGNFYYNLPTGLNVGGGSSFDFLARFPEGAKIEPGEYQTISIHGSGEFFSEYGTNPTYELFEDNGSSDAIPDMREAIPGSINNQGGLTNSGEVVILFYWDGKADLVKDLDYVVWGDKAEAIDKTGISIDGPDMDMDPSAYQDETTIAEQIPIRMSPHSSSSSWQRSRLDEFFEIQTNGNGFDEDDETSEDQRSNWCTDTPTPNAASVCVPATIACGSATHFIHDIQGDGSTTPLDGEIVKVRAIVVGDFQGNDFLDGFYIQEEDADTDVDDLTSEGIFVYEGNHSFADVTVGDEVFILGVAGEFGEQTQISNLSGVLVCSSDNLGLVTPKSITLPLDSIGQQEHYEGMLVQSDNELTVIDITDLDRYGKLVLSGNGTQTQYTEENIPDVAGNTIYLENQALFRLNLDDQVNEQNVFPNFHMPLGELIRTGYTIETLQGVMTFVYNDEFRIRPNSKPNFIASNPRPANAPQTSGALRIASVNLENYFTTLNERGANSMDEFKSQNAKLKSAFAKMNAGLVGLVELENNYTNPTSSAIQSLVDTLNEQMGPDTYNFINPGQNVGSDDIAVGIIYQTALLDPVGDPKILDDPMQVFSASRAILAQTFLDKSSGQTFTVAVNHFKSKGSQSPGTENEDQNDGQGRNNAIRVETAQALSDWLATDPTESEDPDFLIIGDLNAYEFEDPITSLENAGYVNLVSEGISFQFDGYAGTLDYILASPTMAAQFSDGAKWNINASEPDLLSYQNGRFNPDLAAYFEPNEFRFSNHDPVIASFNLQSHNCSCRDQINVSLDANCTYTLDISQVVVGLCTDTRIVVNDGNPGNGATIDCPGLYTYGV
ncbi:MAG: ExeM/NucH family extracellular endonuclease, partial [Saprospiraceae bacterium]|nr:ExeM/NucH family extracellular endonuclease [Saprospiraceae bacterium]